MVALRYFVDVLKQSHSKHHVFIEGALLLEAVAVVAGIEGISAIIDAAKERFSESQREKASGSPIWWRVSCETLPYGENI